MVKSISIVLTLVCFVPCLSHSQSREVLDSLKAKAAGFQVISMTQLIAHPRAYQGKHILAGGDSCT